MPTGSHKLWKINKEQVNTNIILDELLIHLNFYQIGSRIAILIKQALNV